MADEKKTLTDYLRTQAHFILWAVGIIWIAMPVMLWLTLAGVGKTPTASSGEIKPPGGDYIIFVYIVAIFTAGGVPFFIPKRGNRSVGAISVRVVVGLFLTIVLSAAVNILALKQGFICIAGTYFLLLLYAVFVFSVYLSFDSIPRMGKAAHPIAIIVGYFSLGWVFLEPFFYSIGNSFLREKLLNLALALNPSFALAKTYLGYSVDRMSVIYMKFNVMDLQHRSPSYFDSVKAYAVPSLFFIAISAWPLYRRAIRSIVGKKRSS